MTLHRLDHIAVGVRAMVDCIPLLEGELGARPDEGGPSPGFDWAQWKFGNAARLELITPSGKRDFMHRFMESRGPGPHHVTFKVPDMPAMAKRAGELGYEVTGFNDSWPSWKECFLHPKQAQGIVVQIAESHPELSRHEPEDWQWPTPAPQRPDPADLLGMRLSARSKAEALKQWGQLLEGKVSQQDDLLVFRWPDSPMRLRIRIDAERTPGPEQLELQSSRKLSLPRDIDPVLGVALVQVD